MLRRTFWMLVPVGLMVLAVGCGTLARSPADPSASTPDSGEAQSSDPGSAASPLPAPGGRDPPAGGTPGAVETSHGDASGWAPNAVVERVVDGDTIVATIGGRSETVRLIGVDTPESVAPTRPVQCYGKEASLFLAAVLPAGTGITLLRDVEARDVYDRLLGYVVRSSDGIFVNLELVAAGYAAVLSYPPNDHYAAALDRAQAEAVASGRGLWSACGGPDVPLD